MKLQNIEHLIDGNGDITIGRLDAAIGKALEDGRSVDEISPSAPVGPRRRARR